MTKESRCVQLGCFMFQNPKKLTFKNIVYILSIVLAIAGSHWALKSDVRALSKDILSSNKEIKQNKTDIETSQKEQTELIKVVYTLIGRLDRLTETLEKKM